MNTLIFCMISVLILGSLIEFKQSLLLALLVGLGVSLLRVVKPIPNIPKSFFSPLFCCLTLFAFLWSSWFVDRSLEHRLPIELNNQTQTLEGCVVTVPELRKIPNSQRSYRRFEFKVTHNRISQAGLRRVLLSLYRSDLTLRVGECFRLTAHLRSARNLANGLPFDYEAYMLFKGIDATGYIRQISKIGVSNEGSYSAKRLETLIDNDKGESTRWIRGLVFGDKQAFSAEEWRQVRDTGTLHLLVVSGLHVGLISLLGLIIGKLIARLLVLTLRFHAGHLSTFIGVLPSLMAVIAATGYLFLAGAGLSLIRAWLMALMAVLVWAAHFRISPLRVVLLAMLLIMLFNPMAWSQSGFWYSFAAVFSLLLVFVGVKQSWVAPWLVPQLAVSLLIFPVMMLWGQTLSLSHLLANTLLIPLVSFLLLPLSFLAFLTDLEWMHLGLAFFGQIFWQLIVLVQSLALPDLSVSSYVFILIWLVLAALLAVGGGRRAFLISAFSLILGFTLLDQEAESGLWLFDAGQGQSLLVSDGEHSLVLDTGARFSDAFSIADAVVIPWVRRIGHHSLDALVISHSDNDHAGGMTQILNTFEVDHLVLGQPEKHQINLPIAISNCHQLNLVRLSEQLSVRFFSVPEVMRVNDNDASCVVQLNYFGYRILVPGDLTHSVEEYLVERYGHELKSDLLIAGHHGSKSSTSKVWLARVQPKWVWVSSGYQNRFGHPHSEVLERINNYSDQVDIRITARDGMLNLTPKGQVKAERDQWQPRWRVQ